MNKKQILDATTDFVFNTGITADNAQDEQKLKTFISQALDSYRNSILELIEGKRKKKRCKIRYCNMCDKRISSEYCPDCGDTYSTKDEYYYEDMNYNKCVDDIKQALKEEL